MKIDFNGLNVLVTGGTRGIGQAVVTGFLNEGAHVIATGRTTMQGLDSKRLTYHCVDFCNDLEIEQFIKTMEKAQIDVLINNAGINKIDTFGDIDIDDWKRIQKVNVEVPFLLCKRLVPKMAQKGFGRVVNIGSIFSHVSKEKRGSYSTSKFALLGMTKALSLDYAAAGVLVNMVSPGFVDTDLTRNVLTADEIKRLVSTVPVNRLATPDEIAKVILFLSSRQNSFITGQNIIVDGGFTSV